MSISYLVRLHLGKRKHPARRPLYFISAKNVQEKQFRKGGRTKKNQIRPLPTKTQPESDDKQKRTMQFSTLAWPAHQPATLVISRQRDVGNICQALLSLFKQRRPARPYQPPGKRGM